MLDYTPYIVIRLSSLEAHHDINAKGISNSTLITIINKLKDRYKIFISSEKRLSPQFEAYRMDISPICIHHIIAYSTLVIADSQTMIAEAGVLGVRNLRVSTFKNKIGYLDALESMGLCTSISPSSESIIPMIETLLSQSSEELLKKRSNLINSTIDPINFFWEKLKST